MGTTPGRPESSGPAGPTPLPRGARPGSSMKRFSVPRAPARPARALGAPSSGGPGAEPAGSGGAGGGGWSQPPNGPSGDGGRSAGAHGSRSSCVFTVACRRRGYELRPGRPARPHAPRPWAGWPARASATSDERRGGGEPEGSAGRSGRLLDCRARVTGHRSLPAPQRVPAGYPRPEAGRLLLPPSPQQPPWEGDPARRPPPTPGPAGRAIRAPDPVRPRRTSDAGGDGRRGAGGGSSHLRGDPIGEGRVSVGAPAPRTLGP